MSKPGWMARQGDVLVIRVGERPKGDWREVPREGGRVVLAHGEVTGHAHAIAASGATLLQADGMSDRILAVVQDMVDLVHEEHATVTLARGDHIVRIQREWAGKDERMVQD